MSLIRCPHCGTSNRLGSNFCNSCGTELRSDDSAPAARPPQDEPARDAQPRDPDQPAQSAGAPPTPPDQSPAQPPAEPAPDPSSTEPSPPSGSEPPIADSPGQDWDLGEQPWLSYGFDEEEAGDRQDEPPIDPLLESQTESQAGPRLITGIQGLLDPIRISSRLEETAPQARRTASSSESLPAEQLRRSRALLREDPLLTGTIHQQPSMPLHSRLYIRWIFLLVALLVGIPILLRIGGPGTLPPQWPGVAEAYAAIQSLPPDAVVFIYWAYDPATAGELNLAAKPVLHHLFERRARLAGVSPLPLGPATARRAVEDVRQARAQTGIFAAASQNPWPVAISFLPGGTSALPLLAEDPARAILFDSNVPPALQRNLFDRPPALAVVFGAQAEDVQYWLEQVQARNGVPVVAVTSAAADPILRPYLDSAQLIGLVSGFDGGYHYQARLEQQGSRVHADQIRRHAGAQNWAHLAIFVVIILGNLAAITGRPS